MKTYGTVKKTASTTGVKRKVAYFLISYILFSYSTFHGFNLVLYVKLVWHPSLLVSRLSQRGVSRQPHGGARQLLTQPRLDLCCHPPSVSRLISVAIQRWKKYYSWLLCFKSLQRQYIFLAPPSCNAGISILACARVPRLVSSSSMFKMHDLWLSFTAVLKLAIRLATIYGYIYNFLSFPACNMLPRFKSG